MKKQVYLFYDIALCHYYAGKITAKYKIVWLVDLTNLISQMSDIRQWCDENKDTLLFIVLRKGWLGKVDDFIEKRINVIDYPKDYPQYTVFIRANPQPNVPVQNNMCINGAILVTKDWLKQKDINEATMLVSSGYKKQTIEIYI